MSKKITYFIDYDCDAVRPCGGKPELVVQYADLMKKLYQELLGIYKTKLEMYQDVAEFANQARHGVFHYEYMEDDYLKERIADLEEEIREEEKAIAKKESMILIWSKLLPTQDGYYWMCGKWDGAGEHNKNETVLRIGHVEITPHGIYCEETVNVKVLYWAGPIEPPELPEEMK